MYEPVYVGTIIRQLSASLLQLTWNCVYIPRIYVHVSMYVYAYVYVYGRKHYLSGYT